MRSCIPDAAILRTNRKRELVDTCAAYCVPDAAILRTAAGVEIDQLLLILVGGLLQPPHLLQWLSVIILTSSKLCDVTHQHEFIIATFLMTP